MPVNRTRGPEMPTISGMGDKQLKKILWNNVRALMLKHYGAENLNRLAREAKIGPGSASRIKEARTSIGLDVLEKVAHHFRVDPWELLMPERTDEKMLALLRAWSVTSEVGRELLRSAAVVAIEKYGESLGEKRS